MQGLYLWWSRFSFVASFTSPKGLHTSPTALSFNFHYTHTPMCTHTHTHRSVNTLNIHGHKKCLHLHIQNKMYVLRYVHTKKINCTSPTSLYIFGKCPETLLMTTADGSNMFLQSSRVSLQQWLMVLLGYVSSVRSSYIFVLTVSTSCHKMSIALEREGEELMDEWTIRCRYQIALP